MHDNNSEFEADAGILTKAKAKLQIVRKKKAAEDFEGRLECLEACVPKDVAEDPSSVWIKGERHVRDPNFEWRVKVESVRWMLRVSKHLEEPARQRVLMTVRKSLDDLERTIGTESHAA